MPASLSLAITIGLCIAFTDVSPDRFQFVTSYEWIRALGVSFSLGVDGIALVLIAYMPFFLTYTPRFISPGFRLY